MNLYEYVQKAARIKNCELTKELFGTIMHDENYTDEQKQEALKKMMDMGGYENLPD